MSHHCHCNSSNHCLTGETDGLIKAFVPEMASFVLLCITAIARSRTWIPDPVSLILSLMAGLIPTDRTVRLQTICDARHSSLARMVQTIEKAAESKSITVTLLRRITRWYTPIVMAGAVLLFVVAWFVMPASEFQWQVWLNRSLIFLVCSCPCALVVSVLLTYFASLGRASSIGILVKGSNSFDALYGVDTIAYDKTGTVTTGKFRISDIRPLHSHTIHEIIAIAAGIEAKSIHPLALSIRNYAEEHNIASSTCTSIRTLLHGMEGACESHLILMGLRRLMDEHDITSLPESQAGTEILLAQDGVCIGTITLQDEVKPAMAHSVKELRKLGIKNIAILSGDKVEAMRQPPDMIGADIAVGSLTPDGKYHALQQMKEQGMHIAFLGDGMNDAAALASADVGIAMGNAGTDVAMENADIVMTGDDTSQLPLLLRIARKARRVAVCNVVLALGIKGVVMLLGACGLATLCQPYLPTPVSLCSPYCLHFSLCAEG